MKTDHNSNFFNYKIATLLNEKDIKPNSLVEEEDSHITDEDSEKTPTVIPTNTKVDKFPVGNTKWMEDEDSYNLDNLFTVSNEESNKDIFEEESLNLEELFEEENKNK